jgi:hypothetical protein
MIENEFIKIRDSKNPKINNETQFIWVLSSRHTVNLDHINCVQVSQNFIPNPYDPTDYMCEKECDIEDDLVRLNTAIKIGKKIKNHPYIIYNGWPDQNKQLKSAIYNKNSLLDFYPAEKFIIFEMPELYQNTLGQFMSFQNEINTNDILKPLKLSKTHLLIVTSAYHGPRVRRYFNSPVYGEFLNHLENITFYLIDRKGIRPCAQRDIDGEKKRIKLYTEKGWLGLPKNIIF